MKVISVISPKYGSFEVLVDDEDFETVSKYTWHVEKSKHTFYAATSYRSYGNVVTMRMHRLLTELMSDHIDGNGLNNQRSNLRACTFSQNNANMKSRTGSSSSYLGVSWCNRQKKWRASIQKNGKSKSLGYWDSEIKAAKVYNFEAIKLHGTFTKLNTIPDE